MLSPNSEYLLHTQVKTISIYSFQVMKKKILSKTMMGVDSNIRPLPCVIPLRINQYGQNIDSNYTGTKSQILILK